jgi:hypothetical protein
MMWSVHQPDRDSTEAFTSLLDDVERSPARSRFNRGVSPAFSMMQGVHQPDRDSTEAFTSLLDDAGRSPARSRLIGHRVTLSRQGTEPGDAGESSRDLHNPRIRAQNLGTQVKVPAIYSILAPGHRTWGRR